MDFNINKYNNVRFSDNELTHKRVKALLLWFEYEVYKNRIPLDGQIKLLDRWLKKLLEKEYYEVLPFFEKKKNDMIKELIQPKHVIVSAETKSEPYLIKPKSKLIRWYRSIFK